MYPIFPFIRTAQSEKSYFQLLTYSQGITFVLADFNIRCLSWRNPKDICVSSWDRTGNFSLFKLRYKLLHYVANFCVYLTTLNFIKA